MDFGGCQQWWMNHGVATGWAVREQRAAPGSEDEQQQEKEEKGQKNKDLDIRHRLTLIHRSNPGSPVLTLRRCSQSRWFCRSLKAPKVKLDLFSLLSLSLSLCSNASPSSSCLFSFFLIISHSVRTSCVLFYSSLSLHPFPILVPTVTLGRCVVLFDRFDQHRQPKLTTHLFLSRFFLLQHLIPTTPLLHSIRLSTFLRLQDIVSLSLKAQSRK